MARVMWREKTEYVPQLWNW